MTWTDDSALFQMDWEPTARRESAKAYLRMRLAGYSPEAASALASPSATCEVRSSEDTEGDDCDECGASIPDTERAMVNASHARSCSLYPDNP